MRNAWAVTAVVMMCGAASAGPPARQTLGTASFAIPKGWTLRQGDAADHIGFTKADNKQYCIISVFSPLPASADAESSFATAWADALSTAGTAPKSSARKLGTRSVREGGVQATIEGTDTYAAAHVLVLEQQIVTVISYSTNAKALAWCRPDLDKVLTDIKVSAAVAAPAAVPAAPAPALPPVGGATVRIADLVGKWANNGAATTSYVDSNGNYSGTSTTFFGEWYTIKADGSYAYSFQGRANNHTVRETGTGKISFSGDLVVIAGTRAGTKFAKKYHLIDYRTAADGTAVLTLLDEQYPADAGNTGLYKEVWIKNPAQKQ